MEIMNDKANKIMKEVIIMEAVCLLSSGAILFIFWEEIIVWLTRMVPGFTLKDALIGLFLFFIIGCVFGDYLQGESYGGGWLWKGRTREEQLKYIDKKIKDSERRGK